MSEQHRSGNGRADLQWYNYRYPSMNPILHVVRSPFGAPPADVRWSRRDGTNGGSIASLNTDLRYRPPVSTVRASAADVDIKQGIDALSIALIGLLESCVHVVVLRNG